jgi:PhnB protein
MELSAYLFFSGNCEEALNFYKTLFGGEITELSRYKDSGENSPGGPELAEKVMHATFKSTQFEFMASDSRPTTQYGEGRISLSLSNTDVKEAQRVYDALAAGGKVEVEFQDMFWGAKFGMLTDKFGIDWMINCQLKPR